jgi:hypothetical protein
MTRTYLNIPPTPTYTPPPLSSEAREELLDRGMERLRAAEEFHEAHRFAEVDHRMKLSDAELKAEYEKRQERERINSLLRQPALSPDQLFQMQADHVKQQADEWTAKRRAFENAAKRPAEGIDEFEARRTYLKLEAEFAHPEAIRQAQQSWIDMVLKRTASETD